MNKKIFGLALIACSLFSFNAFAQTSAPTGKACEKKECCQQKKCDKPSDCGKKDCKPGECRKGKFDGKKGQRVSPFEGLNLSEAQKEQLKQLDAKRFEARKSDMQKAKIDRQVADSAKKSARKAGMKEYLSEVKTIIGPDMYVQFLENMVINGGGQQGMGREFTKGMPMRKIDGPKGMNKDKGQKAGKPSKDGKDKKGKKQSK